MPQGRGEILEIWLEQGAGGGENIAGRIACPPGLFPAPGQYLLAHPPELTGAPLPIALFPGRQDGEGLVIAPPLPSSWLPGMPLDLRGPLGKGFRLPPTAQRLALVAAGSPHRLLPLVDLILDQSGAAILFCDPPLPANLPTALEVAPLSELSSNLSWPDFIAVDLFTTEHTESTEISEKKREKRENSESRESRVENRKNAPHGSRLSVLDSLLSVNSVGSVVKICPGQVLVSAPLPCGGIAECGACAVHTRGGWKLACKDGPVFDLSELEFSR